MKIYLILLLFLIPIIGFSQKEKHTISGTIMSLSHHQGGMENPYEPQAFPKGGVTLFIIKVEGNKKPKQVGEITSELDGSFKISLPPGKYGFVLKEDLRSLEVGQFLPKGWSRGDMIDSSSSSWTININAPVVVVDKDFTGIIITNYNYSICGRCP